MAVDSGNFIKRWARVVGYLFPDLLPIFIGDYFLVYVYQSFNGGQEVFSLMGYTLAQIISIYTTGWLSDRFGRKRTLIFVLLLTIILFALTAWVPYGMLIIFIIGACFNPGPAARSSILHNQEKFLIASNNRLTPVRLLAITWITQYTPWSLFILVKKINTNYHYPSILLLLLIGLTLAILSYIQELKHKESDVVKKTKHASSNKLSVSIKGVVFILLGGFFAQNGFWLPFQEIELVTNRGFFFTFVGIGATIGSVLTMLHKKTPHLIAISNFYGIGLGISLICWLFYLFPESGKTIPEILIALVAMIGGFYLPYLFDVITRGKAKIRGVMLASAEIMQTLSSVFSILLLLAAGRNPAILFLVTTLSFLVARYFHLREEKRELRKWA